MKSFGFRGSGFCFAKSGFKIVFSPLFLIVFILSGCATTLKKSPTFEVHIQNVKTIAVMPPDIEVYQLTAGGVRELMDEWSDLSKSHTQKSLEKHLGGRYGFTIKFVDEKWLKESYKELWDLNRALYEAVVLAAIFHAYPGPNTFSDKLKNFDYTLGGDLKKLADVCEADALLFVHGFDHEATAGRTMLLFWNILVGAATGITVIPTNPSLMAMGLVDAPTGNLDLFKISPPDSEYSFRNERHIDFLIEWMTRDFLKQK